MKMIMPENISFLCVCRQYELQYDETMFSTQDMVSEAGLSSLLRPIQVWIPSYVQRGSGFDVHFEFEVKVRHCMSLITRWCRTACFVLYITRRSSV